MQLSVSINRVSSRIFCLGREDCDQLCVKHAKFLSPFLSIIHQCTKDIKPEFLLLDIVLIVKTFGGEVGGFGGGGGKLLPPHPPVDEFQSSRV